jgi:hypothetical protein
MEEHREKGVFVAVQEHSGVRAIEWVRPLPEPHELKIVSHIRGTLLVASRTQIRSSGRFDAYERLLASSTRRSLEEVVPASWLPIDLAVEHWDAIDRLDIPEAEVLELTSAAARQTQGVLLSTLSKMAQTGGLTLWSAVPLSGRVWERMFVGGALAVAREGPKDAVVVVAGHPLIRSRYHRLGIGQHLTNAVHFVVGKRAYVRQRHADPEGGRAEFLVLWV